MAEIVKETSMSITYRTSHGLRKEAKHMCIGGPLDRQWVTTTQLAEGQQFGRYHPRSKGGNSTGYFRYNAAGLNPFKALWVYLEKQT